MKSIIVFGLVLVLNGCATTSHPSTQQNYRAKGSDNQIKINAAVVHKENLVNDDYAVVFQIDGKPAVGFQLNAQGNGSYFCDKSIDGEKGLFFCYPHNGNKIGASCNGSTVNGKVSSVYCSFEYNNEIAANFTVK